MSTTVTPISPQEPEQVFVESEESEQPQDSESETLYHHCERAVRNVSRDHQSITALRDLFERFVGKCEDLLIEIEEDSNEEEEEEEEEDQEDSDSDAWERQQEADEAKSEAEAEAKSRGDMPGTPSSQPTTQRRRRSPRLVALEQKQRAAADAEHKQAQQEQENRWAEQGKNVEVTRENSIGPGTQCAICLGLMAKDGSQTLVFFVCAAHPIHAWCHDRMLLQGGVANVCPTCKAPFPATVEEGPPTVEEAEPEVATLDSANGSGSESKQLQNEYVRSLEEPTGASSYAYPDPSSLLTTATIDVKFASSSPLATLMETYNTQSNCNIFEDFKSTITASTTSPTTGLLISTPSTNLQEKLTLMVNQATGQRTLPHAFNLGRLLIEYRANFSTNQEYERQVKSFGIRGLTSHGSMYNYTKFYNIISELKILKFIYVCPSISWRNMTKLMERGALKRAFEELKDNNSELFTCLLSVPPPPPPPPPESSSSSSSAAPS